MQTTVPIQIEQTSAITPDQWAPPTQPRHTGEIRGDDIMVIVPTRYSGGPRWQCVNAVAEMCRQAGTYFQCAPGEPRAQNRNKIARQFLDTQREWLMMIDDDIAPPTDCIRRLAVVRQDIVVAPCPVWSKKGLCANVGDNVPTARVPTNWPSWFSWDVAADPFIVGVAGTGVILTHRRVFETTPYPWFVEDYGDMRGEYGQTEDIYFCRRVREAGFNIWVHPAAVCDHFNTLPLSTVVPKSQVKPGD